MPTINRGDDYFQAVTYTGNGSTNTITGLRFQPDFVWVKGRSGATDHALYDAVRGTTKDLVSNSTAAETTQSTGLTAFNSDGFTLGALAKMNTNAATYVAWCWKAGGSTSSNTSGSITSTVSANTTAGFSVVTYTGTGANATVGHGLGVAPSMIFFKQRSGGTARAWQVYHVSMGNGGGAYLNQTNAYSADATAFNNTSPTSSVFTIGSSIYPNQSGSPIVAYCWAAIPGFSAFGSYTGNGSTNGPFIYTNFRPEYILIKNTTNYDWHIFDATRNSFNLTNSSLKANTTGAEFTNNDVSVDLLSNGFKLRGTDLAINGNGNTHIFAAFAEHPFKNANAR